MLKEALGEYEQFFNYQESDVARFLGMSLPQYSRIKNGKVKIGGILMRRITQRLPIIIILACGEMHAISTWGKKHEMR